MGLAAKLRNLLLNSDFELGCGGWESAGSVDIDTVTVRPGKQACRLCSPPGSNVSFYQDVKLTIVAGERFAGEFYLHGVMGDAMPTTSALATSLTTHGAGAAVLESSTSPGPIADNTGWKPITAVLRATAASNDAQFIRFAVYTTSVGGCFVVDDARLYVVP